VVDMTVYNIRQRFMINYSSAADNPGLIRSEQAPLWKCGAGAASGGEWRKNNRPSGEFE